MQWENKLREHKMNPIYTTKRLCVYSPPPSHTLPNRWFYTGLWPLLRPNRPENGSLEAKMLGVPPHANAGDKEHCGKQRDCRKEEGSGRVVFGNIYTWNISPVMEENQRIRAHQHRRRIIMHYGHSFTLTQILQFVKLSRESRWEMKRNLLAGRLLKSPLGCTCSRWVWIKV